MILSFKRSLPWGDGVRKPNSEGRIMSTYREVKRVSHRLFTMILGGHGNERDKSKETKSAGRGAGESTLSSGAQTAGT